MPWVQDEHFFDIFYCAGPRLTPSEPLSLFDSVIDGAGRTRDNP